MAETMQVELVSPEKKLASLEADSVSLPGGDGDFTAMPGHAPTATTLRPGVVSIKSGNDTTEFLIAGGFAEVTGENVSILAEYAANRDEADRDALEAQLAAISSKIEKTEGLRQADAKRDEDEMNTLLNNVSK